MSPFPQGEKNRAWMVCLLFLALSLSWIGCAAAPSVEPEVVEPPEGGWRNTLRWTTASEVDNFGYDVYRSLAEEGPFDRITPEPIAGQGTTDEPTDYEWADTTIDPRVAYFYYIESISLSGGRERFTPIFQSKAKIPSDAK